MISVFDKVWCSKCFKNFESLHCRRGFKVLICCIGFKGFECFKCLIICHGFDLKNGLLLSNSSNVSRVSSVFMVSTVSPLGLIYMSRTTFNNDEPYKCFKALRVSRVWSVPRFRKKLRDYGVSSVSALVVI